LAESGYLLILQQNPPKKHFLHPPVTHLPTIHTEAALREKEHDAFTAFLKTMNEAQVDAAVHALAASYEAQIDCTACGNCCRSLMINVSTEEADALSDHLAMQRSHFDQTYLEKGIGDTMLMNTIPCHFLTENRCSVYEHRFAGCREFPGLHLPGVCARLFSVFMHYGRCPIVFNVLNALKTKMGFVFTDGNAKTN